MKNSIFFNDNSNTFKNALWKSTEFLKEIKVNQKFHFLHLFCAKNALAQLFKELQTEFKQFLSGEKMKDNFHALTEISEIDLDQIL